MIIQVCVGSSCHIKGSQDIIELIKNAIELNGYEQDIVLAGSFCIGKCNRQGVTVQVDDEVVTGVNRENFAEFWKEHVVKNI